MELLIRNGVVYDPINGVNGEKMDIAVSGEKSLRRSTSKGRRR